MSKINFAGTVSNSNVLHAKPKIVCNEWIIDSGATDHMCYNDSMFRNLKDMEKHVLVGLLDGSVQRITKRVMLY